MKIIATKKFQDDFKDLFKIRFSLRILFLNLKYFIQKIFRGYSDNDLWGFCDYIAQKLAKQLKDFKKVNVNSHPAEFKNIKEWYKVLDKIIWSFENYGKDDYCFTHYGDMKWSEPDEKGYSTLIDTGCKSNKKKLKKHWEKTNEGLYLFAKHFGNLWD